MRINNVIKQTGLTKKAIYYYIHKGLLTPVSDPHSGYMIFTDEDVNSLHITRKLRALDLSIDDIRDILDYSNTTNYYFVRKLKELNRQKARLNRQEAFLKSILVPINMVSSHEDLLSIVDSLPINEPSCADEELDMTDALMIATFFWGQFMHDTELTEYKRYLWNRLIKYIDANQSGEILSLRNYLYSLTQQETHAVFAQRAEMVDYVASLTEADYEGFVSTMVTSISKKIQNPSFVQAWKKSYLSPIHSSTCFFDSQASDIMREFSPRFASYQDNINACCSSMRDYLGKPEGAELRADILNKFEGNIDIEGNHSGELAALLSFQN